MRSMLFMAAAILAIATTTATAALTPNQPRTMRLGKATHHRNRGHYFNAKYGSGSNVPVGGDIWPVSIYWTDVGVGTPLTTHAAVVDSGSSFIYIPGKGCQGCTREPGNNRYNPANSSTSKVTYVPFSSSYETCNPAHPLQTCTLSGWLYTDVVSLAGFGGTVNATATVGAIESITTNTYQSAIIGGLMGMVGPTTQNVFNQLCVAGSFCSPVWAICMHEGRNSNGTLTIGGVDASLAEGPITYVNRHSDHEYSYRMTVNTLAIGSNTPLNLANLMGNSAILDTGTNDLLLPNEVFSAAQVSMCADSNLAHCTDFFAASNNGGTACFNLTEAEVDAYPNLDFALENNITLTMTSRDYLLLGSPVATSANEYCFGIANGGNLFILGDSIMQHYYLVFAPSTIGWGKVNKDTCGSK